MQVEAITGSDGRSVSVDGEKEARAHGLKGRACDAHYRDTCAALSPDDVVACSLRIYSTDRSSSILRRAVRLHEDPPSDRAEKFSIAPA